MPNIFVTFTICLILIVSCAAFSGCVKPGSASIVKFEPQEASPGMAVLVTTDKPVFGEPPPTIRFGSEAGLVQQVLSSTEALILVPNIPQGEVDVQIRELEKLPGKPAKIRIVRAPIKKLTIEMKGNDIRVLNVAQRGGEFTNTPERDQRRLSFDVLTLQGNLVYSGAIVHPVEGRMEIFDETSEGKRILRGSKKTPIGIFDLKIPNINDEVIVRFYDMPPGADADTREGRATRKFINEIRVK